MMTFIRYLLKQSKSTFWIASITGLLTGWCTAGLISLIHWGLTNELRHLPVLATSFAVLWIAFAVFVIISGHHISKLSQQVVYDLRMLISKSVMEAPFDRTEKRRAEIYAILTEDITMISNSIERLPSLVAGIGTVIGCLAYLMYLSSLLTVILLGGFAITGWIFLVPVRWYKAYARESRDDWNKLFKHFEGLTHGLKELLLNATRRNYFLDQILDPLCKHQMKIIIKSRTIESFISNWGNLVLLLFLAVTVVALKFFPIMSFSEFTGFLTVTAFTLSPLSTFVGFSSKLTQIAISVEQINKLGLELTEGLPEKRNLPIPEKTNASFIRFDNVTHAYYNENHEEMFELGPISIDFKPGELTFLVGGNGSGKSTLAKVLCGLYKAQGGQVFAYDTAIDGNNMASYRQYFSAIFSDFYVFDYLVTLDDPKLEARAEHYLKILKLDHKVTIKNGQLSTTALSQGQRKRLALLSAYLEDRPFYIFDEWAADQDPEYKHVFYNELLPDLKAQGKTILAISHDDNYFQCADRLLKLEDGKLSKTA